MNSSGWPVTSSSFCFWVGRNRERKRNKRRRAPKNVDRNGHVRFTWPAGGQNKQTTSWLLSDTPTFPSDGCVWSTNFFFFLVPCQFFLNGQSASQKGNCAQKSQNNPTPLSAGGRWSRTGLYPSHALSRRVVRQISRRQLLPNWPFFFKRKRKLQSGRKNSAAKPGKIPYCYYQTSSSLAWPTFSRLLNMFLIFSL